MITPEQEAVQYVFDVLNAAMGTIAVPGLLRDLGVKRLILNEPGAPYDSWIGVLFGGGTELGTSGYAEVNVIVDIWSQEVMIGAANNHLAKFTERIQLCRQLLRMDSADLNRPMAFGLMDYPMEPTELTDKAGKKKYFYNATITVPVYVGGGS